MKSFEPQTDLGWLLAVDTCMVENNVHNDNSGEFFDKAAQKFT